MPGIMGAAAAGAVDGKRTTCFASFTGTLTGSAGDATMRTAEAILTMPFGMPSARHAVGIRSSVVSIPERSIVGVE